MAKDLLYFIDRVTALDSFWYANYYLRCMKKAPHGGVEYVYWPNFYLKHRPSGTWNLFCHYDGTIPAFLTNLINEELAIWKECEVDIEELLSLCFGGDFWYAGFRVLKPKYSEKLDATILWNVVSNHLNFNDYFELDNIREILYAFSCYLVQEKMISIRCLDDLLKHECLEREPDKYGLSDVTDAKFGRQGFEIDGKYYLYSLFLDISIGRAFSTKPLTIEILSMLSNVKIKMRCDEHLSVSCEQKIVNATWDSQKFRGIQLVWGDIDNLVYGSETVLHGDPESLHKLLLTILRDQEEGATFFHIGIEELWNPEKIIDNDNVIIVNFIHAKYFPNKQAFSHIDFSVNQYETDIYKLKYADASNDKHITINKYADVHYKIWCVEGESIDVGIWSSLVSATLNLPFRKLFYEMFPDTEEKFSEE